MRLARAMVLAWALLPRATPADPFPTRGGESGILDVPDAEALGRGGGLMAGELRVDHVSGGPTDVGPLPLSFVYGLGRGLDAGLSLREGGRVGDPRPSPLLFGAALKLQIFKPDGLVPGLALEGLGDRLNWKASGALRVVASTGKVDRIRLTAFAGAALSGPGLGSAGFDGGLAGSVDLGNGLDGVLEGLYGPGGPTAGTALRWSITPAVGTYAALSWRPDEQGVRFSLGFAMRADSPEKRRRPAAAPEAAPPPAPVAAAPAAPAFLDDRPHFRLRIPMRGIPGAEGGPRHVQHPPSSAARGPGAAAPQARPPTSEEIRATKLAGLQDQLVARERRLRGAEADLAARAQRIASDRARLDATEQALLQRERQLEGREKRLPPRGKPSQAERDAQAREQRARAAEAEAGRAERDRRVRAEAAQAREAAARAREDQLRRPLAKLQADLALEKARPRQMELLAQANAARERQLGAMEQRLSATRDRLELLDGANGARAERVSARSQRVDAFEERLVAAQKAAEEAAVATAATAAARRKPGRGEKPALVMVVKPPTSIVKASPAPGAAPAAPRATLHTGVAVEKAVAAAAVVYFPTPGQPMRELDREAVENIARLAARESCELLIWARAQNPGLMAEATRRAEELKLLVAKAGPLSEAQVVTRITTRPSATGVDVVVSALREQPVSPAAPGAPAPAPAAASLAEGETGKRQIRETVLKHRPEIEACVEAEMARRGLKGGEATLRLRVDPEGKVARIDAGESALASQPLEQCLRAAAAGWRFPPSDADYAVEVPITVVGAGAKP